MTFTADDRVFETSTTIGTGTYALDGAQSGFIAFAGMGNNNTCWYFATNDTDWEVGIGTVLTGPNRLARTTILRSSNANAAVSWAAGTRKIRCGMPAVSVSYLVPTGTILDFGGTSAPTGFLLCDGSAVNRTTYAALFAAISTTWGVGDGSTTFNLPDLRGRAAIGSGTGSGLTARTVGQQAIGEETHALLSAENAAHTHTGPSHTHGVTDAGHNHALNGAATGPDAGGMFVTRSSNSDGWYASPVSSVGTGISINADGTAATGSSGSGTAHNNMQPSAAVLKIIKT